MRDFTAELGFPSERVTFARWLLSVLARGNEFPAMLAERLEIQADSKEEATDFVKQVLIDIAAEEMGVNADRPGKSFREKFGSVADE